MRNFTPTFTVLLFLSMVSGCTSVKRFKSADYKGEENSLVDMSLFSTRLQQPLPGKSTHNLWDLSAGAQTRLIQILDERYSENEEFTGALNHKYMPGDFSLPLDLTQNTLQMVFTISRNKDYADIGDAGGIFSPADRIEYLKFSLELPSEYKLHFTGWNRYTTEYGEMEIADMSFSRNVNLGADISTKGAGLDVQSTSGRKEDQQIKSRYLKLNGRISPKRLEMEAEGSRETDLSGNVLADVSLQFDAFPEKVLIPVFTFLDNNRLPHLAGLNFADILVPRIKELPDSIMASLKMEYIYRHVRSGWKSFQEWDDRVDYYSGEVSKQVILFNKSDYTPSLYCLGTDVEEKRAIKIRSVSGMDYPLQFVDYRDAAMFLEWLLLQTGGESAQNPSKTIKAAGHSLIWNGQPLSQNLFKSMKEVKVVPVY